MSDVVAGVAGGLDLDEVARGMWEAALPHLPGALEGLDARFLDSIEDVARDAGLVHTVPIAVLLHAFNDGCRQLRAGLERLGTEEGREAARRLGALENVALTRIAGGYCSGLEETMVQLRRDAEEASPNDALTGALKPAGIVEQLSLEVERCRRMDLSLGLMELSLRPAGAGDSGPALALEESHDVGTCLHGCLRRYDSIGVTDKGDFLMLLPDISRRGLSGAAERLRKELDVCTTGHHSSQAVVALAHYDFVDVGAAEILAALEMGMDEARALGRRLSWA